MALSPLQNQTARAEEVQAETQPNKTYKLDYEKGEISNLIDGEAALRQFIRKAIETARFRFLIYDSEYGSELDALIGQDVSIELLETEIKRMVQESLIYDDRISAVNNITITRESDKLFINFDVDTTEGTITEEVTI